MTGSVCRRINDGGTFIKGRVAEDGDGAPEIELEAILALIAAAAPAGTFAGVGVKLRPPEGPSDTASDFALRQYMTVLITGVGLCEPMCPRDVRTLSKAESAPGPKCAGISGSTSSGIAITFFNISSTIRTKFVNRI